MRCLKENLFPQLEQVTRREENRLRWSEILVSGHWWNSIQLSAISISIQQQKTKKTGSGECRVALALVALVFHRERRLEVEVDVAPACAFFSMIHIHKESFLDI